jgi:uncharacterized membrane protein YkgB
MQALVGLSRQISYPFVRIAMGVVLFWIGSVKFADPSPVVGLLGASLPFLASPMVVYVLGLAEVVCAIALFLNFRVQYVGLVLMGLFAGTLLIFLIAPKVVYGDAGFPLLQLPGEFLLKDLVLFASSVSLISMASAQQTAGGIREMAQRRAA